MDFHADDGAKIVAQCSGKGKPAIVLVHGMPLNHDMWKFQIEDLKNKYYVVAPDLRGCGDSAWTGRRDYNLQRWAKDLDAVIQQINSDVHLVGFSMGGAVVMQYMSMQMQSRQLVDQLTLVSAAGPSFGPCMKPYVPARTYARLQLVDTGLGIFSGLILLKGMDDALDLLTRWLFPYADCDVEIDHTTVGPWIDAMVKTLDTQAISEGCKQMQADHTPIINGLKAIHTPTKIIHGCCDPFVPIKLGQYQLSLIPGTVDPKTQDIRFEPLPFSGHGLFFEQRKDLSTALDWQP